MPARRTLARVGTALVAAAALASPRLAAAQSTVRSPEVTASLVAGGAWLRPGAPLPVAVRLQVAPGWYVYWRQPGEAGLPTTVEWRLPRGFAAAPLAFPVRSATRRPAWSRTRCAATSCCSAR